MGLLYLADSNLDWGQALPETAEFCRKNGIKKIHLSYFGLDIPRHYFAENELEVIPPPWEDTYAHGLRLARHLVQRISSNGIPQLMACAIVGEGWSGPPSDQRRLLKDSQASLSASRNSASPHALASVDRFCSRPCS